ncbi:ABC transporter permease [Nocardioides sp. KC13]|uniref:ABC transporter permease n=1 Tax=Nocardioides turkmenicus TaxID=2711220 RepID=A0A6M1R836_9ACTN|nr:ABC transporter permease [Nocardioides sp. KC13]NGN92497.1 ABC transporter permease [Nocardioides sp. KC13]
MTTTTIAPEPAGPAAVRRRERPVPAPIPFGRIAGIELRKMFDTRSGFWLMASLVVLSLAATAATIIFVDADNLDYEGFASAWGIPMSVILPMIAVLAVTSEWSARSALTTFTLVPGRGRVIGAKAVVTALVGVAAIAVAALVGAVGYLGVATVMDLDPVWNLSFAELARVTLASEIGMFMGFMLGMLFRNSPAAIVAYFVYALVLPTVSSALASTNTWWAEHATWFDLNWATMNLYTEMTDKMWAQLGVAGLIWLIIPTLVGLRLVLRSEVK